MSGNDDDREKPPADDRTGERPPQNRGQQPPQGRQGHQGRQGQPRQGAQGQQPQRGHQPRQGGQQPPQGGGPPAQGPPPSARHGSAGGTFSDGVGRKVLLVVAAFAVAGLAFGLLPALYGGQGENPIQVGEQQTETPTPSPEQQEIQQNQFKNEVVNFVIFFGPYLPVGLGAIAGLVLGTKLTAGRQELLVVAGAGAGIGAALFLVLSGFLAVQQAEVFEQSFRFSQPVSFKFGTGLMNGIFVGIPTAIAAAGAAYAGDELAG